MQIEIKENEYCKLNVSYIEDLETVLQKTNEVTNKFKGMNVPGFRPGKAPLDAIMVHYRKHINQELKRELAENAYYNVLTEKNIKPFGKPMFSSAELNSNIFKCEFEVLKKPEFELSKYKEFEIPKPSTEMSTEVFAQKTIEELRIKFGEIVPFTSEDFTQMNDNVIIDCSAKADGKEIDSLHIDGELLTIGSTPIDGFDENILGMKIEETRTFTIKAPDNSQPDLVGKDIEFTVHLKNGTKITPAALDDAFAEKVGFKNFNDLTTNVNIMASNRLSLLEKSKIADQAIKNVVANHQIQVPNWLGLAEAKVLAQNLKIDWEKMDNSQREQLLAKAENNVRLSLVLEKIRENEPDAQLTDEEALTTIKKQLQDTHGKNSQELYSNMLKGGYLPILISRIRDEHTIDFIAKTCTIID